MNKYIINNSFQLICHHPVKLCEQLSFLQKVLQNMGPKSSWVPQELFNALAWPDGPCACYETIDKPQNPIITPISPSVCMETSN